MSKRDEFVYKELSANGMAKSFSEFHHVDWIDNEIVVNNKYGKINMYRILIPGDIEIIFNEYEYFMDIAYSHDREDKQRFVLWLDCEDSILKELRIEGIPYESKQKEQNLCYLINTLFPYKQGRKKGSKGKNLMIFLPDIYLEKFLTAGDEESVLGRFYDMHIKGNCIIKLGDEQVQKIENFFYQWKEHKNLLGLTKYTFQLLEWYFAKLISCVDFSAEHQKLSSQQAIDLYLLQNFINESVNESSFSIEAFVSQSLTPVNKLKELFENINGKTIHEGFKELKLEKAMGVLSTSQKKIAEVAYEFGYANPSNFSAAFKKQYGITPQHFKIDLLTKQNKK